VAFAPQQLDLHDLAPLAVAGDKRWLVARRGDKPVLLHLDGAGRPAEVALPRYGEVAAQAGEQALRLVWTTAPLEWLHIDLADRDRPVVGVSTPIPGLKAGEYPKAVASDGAVALVSLVRDEPGVDGPRSVSETVLLDATTGQRIGEAAALLVWRAHCHGGRCFGAAEGGTPSTFSLIEFGAGGVRTLESFGARDCSGLFAWVDKAQWRVAWARRGSAMTAAVDLQTGAVTTTEVPGQERVCGHLSQLNADGSPAFDPDSVVDLGEGFVRHGFDAHRPVDGEGKPSGPLRFFGHWSYHRHGDDWKDGEPRSIDEEAPIAAAPGSRVLWLARPGAVGVVFTGGDGVPATYLPLRAVCPSAQIPTRPEPDAALAPP